MKSRRRDWSSRFIVIAQFLIGTVVLLGLAAFLSLNPFLITVFAFAQVFMIVGVVMFVIALLTSRRVLVVEEQSPHKATYDIEDPGDRVYVVKSGRLRVVSDASDGRRELSRGDTFGRERNRRAK